jgi:hypothetical protein
MSIYERPLLSTAATPDITHGGRRPPIEPPLSARRGLIPPGHDPPPFLYAWEGRRNQLNEENYPSPPHYGNETDFLGFLQKLIPHESLTLHFELFRFWLGICGDIRIRKTTPRYHRWFRVSVIRGVANSPHHWYAESQTLRITDTWSRRLPASPIRRVGYWMFKKKTLCIIDMESRWLPAPVVRRVADSPYRWVGESPTPRIIESGSRRLRGSVIWGVSIQRKN